MASNAAAAAPRHARQKGGQSLSERLILNVPARFMGPRLLLIISVVFLALFGLVMIYSASSVTALYSSEYGNDPAYFAMNQAKALAVGAVIAFVLMKLDYHIWTRGVPFLLLWLAIVILLLLVHTSIAGQDAYGASRWIRLPGMTLQPSEIAKPFFVIAAATICGQYYEERSIDRTPALLYLALFIALPIVLVFFEPDKGSTIIVMVTLLVMAAVAGLRPRYVFGIVAVGFVIVAIYSFKDDYAMKRIMAMIHPWDDPTGDSYQMTQGWCAFGSGGLFGVGIGYSHQKYFYLPMAYNDFIYAVVGEECGFVGTVGVILIFLVILYASYKIARFAPDLCGRLVACGCSTLLVVQTLVNVGGVLGIIPLSGKPIPFLSCGGSSALSCCILVGLILSVSHASVLPETEHDRQRAGFRLAGDDRDDTMTGVGAVTTRSETRASGARRSFTVVEGGRGSAADAHASVRAHAAERAARRAQRSGQDAGGRDLMDPVSRLRRPDTGPVVRTRTASPHLDGERSGRSRRPGRGR